ncbi:hypothetical protein niasHS_015968 [Heterodera schachtii]|uniref:K Homology domain-containing protein n=1 Tax=Heterodera schachtii TaxID=97005 RepID=A0ABD2HPS8_HETSC
MTPKRQIKLHTNSRKWARKRWRDGRHRGEGLEMSVCPLCDSPVPFGLAMLAPCHHVGHAKCINNFVRHNGVCWVSNCAIPVLESDVLGLHIDSPQPNWIGLNDQQSVREVIGVIRQRLVGQPQCAANATDNDFEEVANIFERLTSPRVNANTSEKTAADSSDEWQKLKDLLQKASPVIVFVVFALLCWYATPLVLSVGAALLEGISSLVMGLGAFLRSFFPELVASGLAFFSAYVLGKKKMPFLRSAFSFSSHQFSSHIRRNHFVCSSFSTKTNKMQNPLEMGTYRVGSETYRRNCPLEKASTAAPAAGAAFGATTAENDDGSADEQTLSPSSSGRCSSSEVRQADFADSDCGSPGKRACISTDKRTATAILTAKAAQEIGEVSSAGENAPLIVQRKTVEDGWVYTEQMVEDKSLVGTVKYDGAKQCFYDSLLVPTNLVGMIRGRNSSNMKPIQEENRCEIEFPKTPKASGTETEIKFSSSESALHVQKCGEALKKELAKARHKAAPTHFISVPIFDLNLREQYSGLVQRILEDEEMPAELRNRDMFMKKEKLHLTINVLKLFTNEEIEKVRKFLHEQFQSDKIRDILQGTGGQLRVNFKTLQPMVYQSKEHCRVLFAQLEAVESNPLQLLANTLDDALTEAELVKKRQSEDVLLHMTVLNTKYLGWQGWRKTVNVTQLLETYGQLNFDPINVEELHLCEMRGSSNADDLNGYVSVHSVKFAVATN